MRILLKGNHFQDKLKVILKLANKNNNSNKNLRTLMIKMNLSNSTLMMIFFSFAKKKTKQLNKYKNTTKIDSIFKMMFN